VTGVENGTGPANGALSIPIDYIGQDAFNGRSINSIYIGDNYIYANNYSFRGLTTNNILIKYSSIPGTWASSWNSDLKPFSLGYDGLKNYLYTPASSKVGYGYVWFLDLKEAGDADNVVTLVKYLYPTTGAAITIPDTISFTDTDNSNFNKTYTVVEIAAEAFYRADGTNDVASITITGTHITKFGDYAFYNLDTITTFTIPASVTTIGQYCFRADSKLATLIFQAGSLVTSLPLGFCYDDVSLTTCLLLEGVTYINDYAFFNCKVLSKFIIPKTLTGWTKSDYSGPYSHIFALCDRLVFYYRADSIATRLRDLYVVSQPYDPAGGRWIPAYKLENDADTVANIKIVGDWEYLL
ncbi:MAG: hypothetical protein EZS28_049507, partial [Streblomastix strix]